jgi:dTDP-4-amino-4,6-dideoxygalactose transaminase
LYLAQQWGWFAELHRRLKRTREYNPKQDFALGNPMRATNYAFLLERLERFVPEPFARPREGASPFAFPIQSHRQEEVLGLLRRHGVAAVNFWSVPHPSLPVADFPQAAALRDSVITLPVHQELSVRELDRIVDAVLTSLG